MKTIGVLFELILLINIAPAETLNDYESSNVKLTEDLLLRHKTKIRPVTNPNDQLIINVLAALYQIVEVDQKSNLVGISAYFDLWWNDSYLTWKPEQYSGTKETYLSADNIWMPDLYLYHSVQGSTPLNVNRAVVQVDYTGRIRAFVPFNAKSLCTINVKYFPFDTQTCWFQFGSWSYKEQHIAYRVASNNVTLNEFYDNQEWYLKLCNISDHSCNRSMYDSSVNETYSTVLMSVTIKRGPFYYVFNLIIPTTLVTIVSVIGFHVAANSTERRESKFRLGIMTLLSMGVLLLNVVDDMPKFSLVSVVGNMGSFSDAPLLGLYYLSLIILVSLCTCSSSLFVTLETYALHHPCHIPIWLGFLAFRWPWQDHAPDEHGCRSGGTMATPPGASVQMSNSRKVSDYCRVNQDANDARARKKTSCISMERKEEQQNSNIEVAKCVNDSKSIQELCQLILNEVKMVRQQCNILQEQDTENFSLRKKKSTLTKSDLLTNDWNKIITRIERTSLFLYLAVVAICMCMFFNHSWY